MTGRELKSTIFAYLQSKGWRNLKPDEYYGWNSPGRDKEDGLSIRHYCWHAAVAVQIAIDEGTERKIPGGFEVVVGGRK